MWQVGGRVEDEVLIDVCTCVPRACVRTRVWGGWMGVGQFYFSVSLLTDVVLNV